MAKEGAYSKAVAGLKGGIKQLSPSEQLGWANKLVPREPVGADPLTPISQQRAPITGQLEDARAWDDKDPLNKIRFPPLAGAGPSGLRAEHMNEMLRCPRRAVARRLRRPLGLAIQRGSEGMLPPTFRWMLGSSVTFLSKPGKDDPRPIRAGEWLRKVIA